MTWLEQFKLNYDGKSDEAKSLEGSQKSNYKGNAYIPWATMERLTYLQDPEATFEVLGGSYGGVLHTDSFDIKTVKESITETKTTKETTLATGLVHFVVVKATFLGKVMTEHYPVQDNAYNAPKAVDQNMVNKALQRAKAKIASRITGIGFKLYEGSDLQFEDDGKPVVEKPVVGKTLTPVVQPTTSAEQVVIVPQTKSAEAQTQQPAVVANATLFAQEILDNPLFDVGLAKVNVNLEKTQKFTISREETLEGIATKLSTIKTLDMFMKALRRQSGINA